MRIAFIADIHGNCGALDAVLADIEGRAVEMTVNLGDVVSGPLQPRETADRLMTLAIPTIRGNHERQLLTRTLEEMGESDRFAASQLRADQRAWLAGFPDTLVVAGDVLMCHGTPASDLDYLLDTVDKTGCRPALRDEVEQRAAGLLRVLDRVRTYAPTAHHAVDGRTHGPESGQCGIAGLPGEMALFPHDGGRVAARTLRHCGAGRSALGLELIEVAYDWEGAARRAEANGRADWAVGLRTGRV